LDIIYEREMFQGSFLCYQAKKEIAPTRSRPNVYAHLYLTKFDAQAARTNISGPILVDFFVESLNPEIARILVTLYEEDQPDTLSEIYKLARKAEKILFNQRTISPKVNPRFLPTHIPLEYILIVKPQQETVLVTEIPLPERVKPEMDSNPVLPPIKLLTQRN
jgi:hypothetical protein